MFRKFKYWQISLYLWCVGTHLQMRVQKSYIQGSLYGETLSAKKIGHKLSAETTHDCCWCCWLLLLLSKQVTVSNSSKQFQTKCLKVYEWLMSLYFRTMKKYWNDNIFWALLLLIFLLWLNVTLTFFSTLTANMAICIVNISACNEIFLSPLYFLIIFEVWIWLNLLFPCQL